MVSDDKVENQAGASDGSKELLLKSLEGYYNLSVSQKQRSCKKMKQLLYYITYT